MVARTRTIAIDVHAQICSLISIFAIMVLPFESYFHEERVQLEQWSRCLFSDLRWGKSSCEPYDVSSGFPFRVFGLCILYSFGFLLFIRRFIAIPMSRVALGAAQRRAPLTARAESLKAREFRHRKFIGSFVEFWFYSLSFAIGAVLLLRQPWSWPSREWFAGAPAKKVDPHLLIFALFYAARYCATFISLTILEPRKKDFVEMSVHHIVTVLLVCLATAYGYVRIAVVVMVLFDAADPFLHLAKMFNYIKQSAGNTGPFLSFTWAMSQLTDVFLAGFAVAFIITRIVIYAYIVYSVSYESYLYSSCTHKECTFSEGFANVSAAHHVCVLLIWVINGLQWYWFRLLLIVIYRSLVEGVSEDARSDMSQDDDDSTKTTLAKNERVLLPKGIDDTDGDDGDSNTSAVQEKKKIK